MADTAVLVAIMEQFGGRRFMAMTGAKNFVAHEDGVSFKLPSGGATKGINYVRVKLNAMDTYDMEFSRVRGLKVTQIATESGVYNDQLQAVFTRVTGLQTSLGTMGARA